jgi:YVTN family beta-propeller protein
MAVLGAATVSTAAHNSRLAVSPDGRALVTVNTDNGSISLVDLKARTLTAEIPVGKAPQSACYIGPAPQVAVTLWDDDRVAIVDIDRREVVRRIEVPDEPYGIVATADGHKLYVTHTYPGLVTEIDPDTGKVLRRFELGDSPRGIALTTDGTRLLVTHDYNGWLSALDLAAGQVVDRWKGASADNLARQVVPHPSLPIAYIPHIRSRVVRAEGSGSIFPFVTVVDLKPGEGKRRYPIAMDNYNGIVPTADPSEVAISPDGRRHYVVYGGTNDMNVSEIVQTGYPYLRPIGGLVRLGHNPKAVAVSMDSREVYVLNSLDFAVWVFESDPFRKVAEIEVSHNPFGEQLLAGKRLFRQAGNPMSSRRWISCNSCHPGGDHDGRTWQNPEGKRNTTALFGVARTHPLHWSADRDEMHDFEHTIRGPLMQGRGLLAGHLPDALGPKLAGRSADLDALAAYCNSLEPTLSPHAAGPGKLDASAERGRVLFESEAIGCARCHPAPMYTDSKLDSHPFVMHDVGTGTGDPTETLGPAFDTPSLVGVYRSAPYLHDGRATTLRDVLTTHNESDRHGKTSHLTPDDLDDLVAFLKSLPYLAESMGVGRAAP